MPDAVTLMEEDQFLVSLPHCAPAADPVPLQEIDQRRLVLYGTGAGRRAIEASFEASGVPLDVPLFVNSFATTKRLIEQNQLLSILPFGAVYREVEDGRLVARRIASPADLSMLLVARTPSCKPMTAAARVLVEILQQQVGKLVSEGRLGVSSPTIRPRSG